MPQLANVPPRECPAVATRRLAHWRCLLTDCDALAPDLALAQASPFMTGASSSADQHSGLADAGRHHSRDGARRNGDGKSNELGSRLDLRTSRLQRGADVERDACRE